MLMVTELLDYGDFYFLLYSCLWFFKFSVISKNYLSLGRKYIITDQKKECCN